MMAEHRQQRNALIERVKPRGGLVVEAGQIDKHCRLFCLVRTLGEIEL
jgi:hypothetical protein